LRSLAFLVKKELILLNKNIQLNFLLLIFGLIALFLFPLSPLLKLGIMIALLGIHIFLVSINILISLVHEWKTQSVYTWLHIPESGYKLILTKIAAPVLVNIISLIGTLFIIYLTLKFRINTPINLEGQLLNVMSHAWLTLFIFIIMKSILLSMFLLFLYLFSRSLSSYGIATSAFMALFCVISWIVLKKTIIYEKLTHWGVLMKGEHVYRNDIYLAPYYFGNVLFDIVIIFLLLCISDFLLNKKVEV